MWKNIQGRIWSEVCRSSKLWVLLVIIVGCSAASVDSVDNNKKVEGVKMKCEQTAKSINAVEAPDGTCDTTPGANGRLNSVDILATSSPKQNNSKTDSAFDGLDEAKKLEQYNDYNKLHSEPPIGDATMDNDGTIKVRIRSMGGMNVSGGIQYAKGSEHYDSIFKTPGWYKARRGQACAAMARRRFEKEVDPGPWQLFADLKDG